MTVTPSSPIRNERAALRMQRTRTCIGCGVRGHAEDMLRYRVAGVVFDPAHTGRGRSVYVHPQAACAAPRSSKGVKRREVTVKVELIEVERELREMCRVASEGARRARRVSTRGVRFSRLAERVAEARSGAEGSRGGAACKLPEVR